jgi:predicted SnoaL-like aldol condensation-catalyzing enzyme
MNTRALWWVWTSLAVCAAGVAGGADLEASQAVPAKGVSVAQMEKNKAVVREFWRPGITAQERYNLLDDEYIQHNPSAKKMADMNHLSAKEGFLKMLNSLGGNFPSPPSVIEGVSAPKGNMLYMVLAEGDLVFVMRQEYRRDPTAPGVAFYPAYNWDVFRVKHEKLYEHWDGATINPPGTVPGGAGGPSSRAPNPPASGPSNTTENSRP